MITHPQLRPKSGHAQVRLVVQHRHLKHSRVCFLLYTANFYSVNFNTMKMKIDAESDFSHSLIVIMFPMDCYLEEHNTRSQSQKTDHAHNQGNIILADKFMVIMMSKM